MPKHDTSKLIPDDGFNEKATTNKVDLCDPSKRAVKSRPILSMIHKYNIAELSLVDRPVQGPATGFGSIVNMHPKDHNKVYAETSNGAHFGHRQPLNAFEVKKKFSSHQLYQAGVSKARKWEEQGVKCNSGLTGEVLVKGDPQESTEVQRAWLPAKDAAVEAAKRGKVDQNPKTDNELSLPLGEGAHANFPLSDEPGFYRHKRCFITNVKNEIISRK